MYTDRNALIEYAYKGTFYYNTEERSDDGDIIGGGSDEGGDFFGDDTETTEGETTENTDTTSTETEVIVLEVDCDIQEDSAIFTSGTMSRGYNVFFPFDETEHDLPEALKPGIFFRGTLHGLNVQGTVVGVYPTQMHGCKVEVKGTDI